GKATLKISEPVKRASRALLSTLALGVLVSAAPALAKTGRHQRCPGGRFMVEGSALVAGDQAALSQPIVVSDGEVSIGAVCQSVRGRLKTSKRGTSVNAHWARCIGVIGRVRLKATILPSCAAMGGVLTVRRARLSEHFSSHLSTCGDGMVDRGAGEECEMGFNCAPDLQC